VTKIWFYSKKASSWVIHGLDLVSNLFERCSIAFIDLVQKNLDTLASSITSLFKKWPIITLNNDFVLLRCACLCKLTPDPLLLTILLNLVDKYSPLWSIQSTLIFHLISFSTMCMNNLNFWNTSSLCFIKYVLNDTFFVLLSMNVIKCGDLDSDGIGKGPKRFEWMNPN
jgi:hypothetical protein